MKPVLIVCLLMLVAGITLAFSLARIGWTPFAFCGSFPFLVAFGLMVLCVVGCLLMRRRVYRRGSAPCACRPPSNS